MTRGAIAPQLACRPKCRIRKNHVFITSETVFCIEIDSKNDITHILKRLIWGGGGNYLIKNKTHRSEKKLQKLVIKFDRLLKNV